MVRNMELSRREIFETLTEMGQTADSMEIDVSSAKQFTKVGEQALAVREYFYLANRHSEFKEVWEAKLVQLNDQFAAESFPRTRMGYPLKWHDE